MGTVIFRNRFEQTRPKGIAALEDPLTLLGVPAYSAERFGIRNLEFSGNHFESLETAYLVELRDRVQAAGCELINVQVDAPYDLASHDEAERHAVLQRYAGGSTPGPVAQPRGANQSRPGWRLHREVRRLDEGSEPGLRFKRIASTYRKSFLAWR